MEWDFHDETSSETGDFIVMCHIGDEYGISANVEINRQQWFDVLGWCMGLGPFEISIVK